MNFIIAIVFLVILVDATNVTEQEFNCLPDPFASCNNHGICINNGTFGFECKCDQNWDNQGCGNVQCCNELYPRMKVFLLAFFVGWTGAPYFVIEEIGLGIGILLLSVASIVIRCCSAFSENGVITLIALILNLAATSWWLAIWIMAAASTLTFDSSKVGPW